MKQTLLNAAEAVTHQHVHEQHAPTHHVLALPADYKHRHTIIEPARPAPVAPKAKAKRVRKPSAPTP